MPARGSHQTVAVVKALEGELDADNILRMLIIEDSVDDAEHLISVLRNAGIAVRPSRPEDAEELQSLLDSKPLDMAFVNTAATLALNETADAITRSGKDIPIIALTEDLAGEQVLDGLQSGATDVVLRHQPELVQRVTQRQMQNLSDRRKLRRLDAALRESEKRCQSLLGSSRDPIAYVHEGMHVYANQAYLDRFEFSDFEEIECLPLLDMVASEHHDKLKGVLRDLAKGEDPPDELEVMSNGPNGHSLSLVMEFSEASVDGEPCTQIVLRDRSDQSLSAQELAGLKSKDLVTNLNNRQTFAEHLDTAIAQAVEGQTDHALLFMEIDNFDQMVSQVGLSGTDLILGDLAGLLTAELGSEDVAGRLSDHSFGILSLGRGVKDSAAFAERIRASLENHISEVEQQSINVTCSVGVAVITESSTAKELLAAASGAAERAQADGGNRIEIFDPVSERDEQGDNSHWASVLESALAENRFMLVFQPIVSLHGAEGEHYEVLLRMIGDQADDIIMPNHFLPAAEQFGLMPRVDRWVINRAIDLLAERREEHSSTTFFVKITPETIADESLLPWIAGRLQEARVKGDSIVFEMPESKVVTNMKPSRKFIRGIKQLHCGFALEQFGSGLNSFQILKHLPADYLKIDRSFMAELPNNEENQTRVRQISDEAHALGKVTIAEFVEDAVSMSVLWQCGVNFVQGNFLQEPEKILAYDFSG